MTIIAVRVGRVVLIPGLETGIWIAEVTRAKVMTTVTGPTGSRVPSARSLLVIHEGVVAPGVQTVAVHIEPIICVISCYDRSILSADGCWRIVVARDTPQLLAGFQSGAISIDAIIPVVEDTDTDSRIIYAIKGTTRAVAIVTATQPHNPADATSIHVTNMAIDTRQRASMLIVGAGMEVMSLIVRHGSLEFFAVCGMAVVTEAVLPVIMSCAVIYIASVIARVGMTDFTNTL
jgi:hypothetical protein